MKLEDIKQAFDKHTNDEMVRYTALHEKLDQIMNNHLHEMTQNIHALELSTTKIAERVKLTMWVFGIVGGAIILALIEAVRALILK